MLLISFLGDVWFSISTTCSELVHFLKTESWLDRSVFWAAWWFDFSPVCVFKWDQSVFWAACWLSVRAVTLPSAVRAVGGSGRILWNEKTSVKSLTIDPPLFLRIESKSHISVSWPGYQQEGGSKPNSEIKASSLALVSISCSLGWGRD